MDQSIINYARNVSLKDLDKNSFAKFNTKSIEVQCRQNNGVVYANGVEYTNKCAFIAIEHGFKHHGITTIKSNRGNVQATAIEFMKRMNFANWHQQHLMFDIFTNNPQDQARLNLFTRLFPQIQLQFYYGVFRNNQWYTAPDVYKDVVFGTGTKIIRILNKGAHFEFITTQDDKFVYEPKTMTPDKAFMDQHEILCRIKQQQEDYKLAIQLEQELIMTEEESLERDRLMAFQLAMESSILH